MSGRISALGGVAVVNGSRVALPIIRSTFNKVVTIHITCRPDVLAARLAARGREDEAGQRQRLARATMAGETWRGDAIEIDNSCELASAGEALVGVIRQHAGGYRTGIA
jgi:ribose 1,5-bisphosphokinase